MERGHPVRQWAQPAQTDQRGLRCAQCGRDVRAPKMKRVRDPAQKEYGWHSRGYLPHFDGGSITQSITFRLFDSLPKAVLEQWSHELRTHSPKMIDLEMRKRIAAYLDQGHGSCRTNSNYRQLFFHFRTPKIIFRPRQVALDLNL